ncbi:MAG: tetratricopeptide repeat protein [Anaerolineales bacterium]|uniref:tetratricopeptide repeat protein n=1 Tax=Candidatus Villigracilis vicinus TaxID=3140679 RepID=UPI0031352461|nr:tetratricopeptide repeat protein [Anaerolineales bacterium]
MLRQKANLYWVGAILAIFIIFPILFTGYSNLKRAEDAKKEGDFAAASQAYAQTAKFFFWQQGLYEQAGINAVKAGNFSEAIPYFQKQATLSEEGWYWFCSAHLQLGELDSALSVCGEGVNQYDSAELYSLLAFTYRTQKKWDSEMRALTEQARLDPSDAFTAYRLGLLLTLYAPDAALPELTRASALNPEVDSAAQALRTALAVSSQLSDPSMKLVVVGQTFGLVQDWELAQAAFEQALQLDEKNAEAWAWLGEAKQQTGGDGSVELDKALSLDRSSVNVRALRGLYWSRQGKYEQMLAEYLLAARNEPQNPRWQASIGEAYMKLGDLVEALMAYQRAVELAPTEAEYWRLLALFCVDNNVQVETLGMQAAQQALVLAPNDPAALDVLGYAYLSTGRYANAEETLNLAIELEPQLYSAHLHLAITFLAEGNRAAAFNSLTYVRDAEGAGVYRETARQLLDKYFQ